MPMYDFECPDCKNKFEEIVPYTQRRMTCPVCLKLADRLPGKTVTFNTIIVDHPGSKKLKAGYQHTHADRPKTPGKIQVGYTGKGDSK